MYDDWVSAMRALGDWGDRLVENIASDRALPEPWREEFESRAVRLFESRGGTGNPIEALRRAVEGNPDADEEALDFKGPGARPGDEPALSTFLREGDTPRTWLERSGVNEAHLLAFVQAILGGGFVADDSYRIGDSPRSRKVWWTFASRVEDRRSRGYDITRLRDALGLSHAKSGLALLQLDCATPDAGELFVPTALDAGDHSSFLPSATPDPAAGRTRDLRTGEAGLPEVVSPPVPVARCRCDRGQEVVGADASRSY